MKTHKVIEVLDKYMEVFGYWFPVSVIDAHDKMQVEKLILDAEEGIEKGIDLLPERYPAFDKEQWLKPHTGIIWD